MKERLDPHFELVVSQGKRGRWRWMIKSRLRNDKRRTLALGTVGGHPTEHQARDEGWIFLPKIQPMPRTETRRVEVPVIDWPARIGWCAIGFGLGIIAFTLTVNA